MTRNKMKEVAQLLGVELGEEFKIKGYIYAYRLTNEGLLNSDSDVVSYTLNRLLTGEYEIEKPILDKIEKCYLENLLRPFRYKIEYVKKINSQPRQEYLNISLNTGEYITLPFFEKNTMYKGMKSGTKYTLKELGLFE